MERKNEKGTNETEFVWKNRGGRLRRDGANPCGGGGKPEFFGKEFIFMAASRGSSRAHRTHERLSGTPILPPARKEGRGQLPGMRIAD